MRITSRRQARAFAGCVRGGLAIWAAAALPAVALVAVGASELQVVSSNRTQLQDVVDAVALNAGRELAFSTGDPAQLLERTKAQVVAQAGRLAEDTTLEPYVEILSKDGDPTGVVVRAKSTRMSFFGNLLPPGGFVTQVQATAEAMGKTSLCVIGLDTAAGDQVAVRDYAALWAPECKVHSNKDVLVGRYANIAANATEAVGKAAGAVTPAALEGAEPVTDPFIEREIVIPACPAWEGVVVFPNGTTTDLAPGVHCGEFVVEKFAKLRLLPGAHYFVGHPAQTGAKLGVKDWATLIGDDVVLYFGADSKLEVQGASTIDLKGRKTGADAGMLLITARESTKTFVLASYAIKRLEGVLYMPNAMLWVSGPRDLIAEQSNWTISITKKLQITGAPILVIRSDYDRSDVPVPAEAKSEYDGSKLTH